VKLFAAAGAWLGPGGTWRAALVAAALGGALAIAMLVRERRTRQGFEKVMVSVSTRSLTPLAVDPASRARQLPYGVALACGALVVAWIPGILA
jgi:Flp pilus assembly protein protease CpaA